LRHQKKERGRPEDARTAHIWGPPLTLSFGSCFKSNRDLLMLDEGFDSWLPDDEYRVLSGFRGKSQ